MTAFLSLRGLTRGFAGEPVPVLRGVDLDVPRGGSVALLGPSGVGKSTVLRLIAGLDRPDGGRILLGGRSLDGVPAEHRRAVVVFQQPRLFPHLDVLGNVAFPLLAAGGRRRQAREDAGRFLELVGLAGLARRRPSTLSGGQAQRVALARALAARPDVLLLDEPFSALDPGTRAEMHDLVHEVRAALGPTILLVTHDRGEAADLSDTVAVLLEGRVVQHATVEELHSTPASLAVNAFLGGRNVVHGEVVDGCHRSALGAIDLPAPAPAGPAALVVRQEAVRLTGADDGAATVVGRVVAVRTLGARHEVTVEVDGVPLVAEAPPPVPGAGRRVGVVVPLPARHVVPAAGLTAAAASLPGAASRS